MPVINRFEDLKVYRAAFRLQRNVFRASKRWPRDETFSLIDQVRRSSRAVGANVAEAWSKRRYPAHFLSKLTDADAELQETRHWLHTARDCEYLSVAAHAELSVACTELGAQLGAMIAKHDAFCFAEA